MWTCASEPTERSANPNQRPSRNSLKPCFVESRSGTRVDRAGELAVDVRVDEVRVQDPRADAAEVARRPRRTRSGRRPRAAGCRRAGRRARAAPRANSQAPGSSSWSMRKRMSQPRSRRSGRSWSRCASEPEMPATFWVWSTTPSVTTSPAASRMPRAHDSTEWPCCDALAQPCAERRPLLRAHRGERPDPVGERARVPAREALLGVEELVEDRVRREHGRQAAAAS